MQVLLAGERTCKAAKALKVTQADAELAVAGPLHWKGQGKNIFP